MLFESFVNVPFSIFFINTKPGVFPISIVHSGNLDENAELQNRELLHIEKTIDLKKSKIELHKSAIILLEKEKEIIMNRIFGDNK